MGCYALKYLSIGSTRARQKLLRRRQPKNSVKKGVYFGTYRSRVSVHASHEALTLAYPGLPCSRGTGGYSGMVWVSEKVSSERILVLLCCQDGRRNF